MFVDLVKESGGMASQWIAESGELWEERLTGAHRCTIQ